MTEKEITTTTTTTIEEKYKVLAPEQMQETFMSDSEDEGGKVFNRIMKNLVLEGIVLVSFLFHFCFEFLFL